MVNPATLMKIMSAKNKFNKTHPKFGAFVNDMIRQGVTEGDVIEISVTRAGGQPVTTNMRVQQSDIELIEELKKLSESQK